MIVFLLWAARSEPPYSALIGIFETRAGAESADRTTEGLGAARHLLDDSVIRRTVTAVPVVPS